MAHMLPHRDVVVIGVGWTGSILAKGLADAGLKVVGLERGKERHTVPDFQSPGMHDEYAYAVRHALMVDPSQETLTFRNHPDQLALPMRRLGSFLPGTGLGGAGVHWNGQTWRFLPSDFRARSHNVERYGAAILEEGSTVQDWPVGYDELEPYYDRFDRLCGIGGIAGNLKGEIRPGGNPFEGPRSNEFPNPPMKRSRAGALFERAATELGHRPFPVPSANMTRAYTNLHGLQLQPCSYCGYCEWFACEHFAKSSPQTCVLPALLGSPNFELRTQAHVNRIGYDRAARKVTGVTYVDASGREFEQPADLVLCCAFSLWNVHLLLVSGIGRPYDPRTGEGTLGRNYSYQTMSAATVFLDPSHELYPFMGAGALGTAIDEFNGDNFDHTGLGFIGGGYLAVYQTGGRPILQLQLPADAPEWGVGWKRAVQRAYGHHLSISVHGASMSHRLNHLDLDPTYTDAFGRPLLRMTFDFPQNDRRMSNHLTDRAVEIARAIGGVSIKEGRMEEHYNITPYQTTHNTGGAIMGSTPDDSVVNRYLQHWDASNLFVLGASAYPQNPGYNPTGTVGALAFWTLDALRDQYLKNPGPLVQA